MDRHQCLLVCVKPPSHLFPNGFFNGWNAAVLKSDIHFMETLHQFGVDFLVSLDVRTSVNGVSFFRQPWYQIAVKIQKRNARWKAFLTSKMSPCWRVALLAAWVLTVFWVTGHPVKSSYVTQSDFFTQFLCMICCYKFVVNKQNTLVYFEDGAQVHPQQAGQCR